MGSQRVVLPEAKFSGQEDVCDFLRDFEIYVLVNKWTGQYLKGLCLQEFAILGQFCAKIITWCLYSYKLINKMLL